MLDGTYQDQAGSRSRAKLSKRTLGAAVVGVAALATAGCGSSSPKSASASDPGSTAQSSTAAPHYSTTIAGQTITTDPKLAAEVPAAIRQAGSLKDVTDNASPPDENIVNGKLVGWEVDLGSAVATTLGLKWQATASGAFDSFIPSLQNGRYDVSFTSFIQTPERLKAIDIVTYYNVGTGFAVKKGSPIKIAQATDLCGHSVAVIVASAFIQQIKAIDCKGAGKPAATVKTFPSNAAGELAVSSGRAEIYSSSDDQLLSLLAKAGDKFELQPLDFEPVPVGAGIRKESQLSKPVTDAMDSLIQSGAYTAIMKKWAITRGLVQKATLYTDGGA
jgi:polar amino acid transport system substrate-binding protein